MDFFCSFFWDGRTLSLSLKMVQLSCKRHLLSRTTISMVVRVNMQGRPLNVPFSALVRSLERNVFGTEKFVSMQKQEKRLERPFLMNVKC